MKLDDLLSLLSNDIANTGFDANSPGEMVRASLANQMPGTAPRMPLSLGGMRPQAAPVMPVARSPMPPPMAAGAPAAPAAPAVSVPSMNPLGTMARGYQSGGLFGAVANLFDEPATLERAAREKAQEEQKATTQTNQTVQAIIARDPAITPEQAAVIARDPAMLREVFKPRAAVDPLDRQKKELELEKLRQEVSGGGVQAQRLANLERLGIDPNSAEGTIYLANGKLPESASKEIIGRQQKAKAGPQVAAGLENLRNMVDAYDETSLESAIGPWQGADPDQTGLLTAPVANIARGLGEAWNVIRGGQNNLSEIRSNIRGTTEALAAAIKPLIRGPGEGVWTDADQARLVAVVGDLAQASTKEEFKRRLNAVRDRIKSNFNIDVPFEANAASSPADDGLTGLSTDELRRRLRGGS